MYAHIKIYICSVSLCIDSLHLEFALMNIKCCGSWCTDTIVWSCYWYQIICFICLHDTKCSTIAWLWVFKVKSCLGLCHGFLGSNPASGCTVDFHAPKVILLFSPAPNGTLLFAPSKHLSLGTVPNIVLWFGLSPIIALSFGPVPNVIQCSGVRYHFFCYHLDMVLNVTVSWHSTIVTISWS